MKLIDFDAAEKLEHAEQVMTRLATNIEARSPERDEEGSECRYLPEDVYMVGFSFAYLEKGLVDETDEDLGLRARLKPLLQRADNRPSMKCILQRDHLPVEDDGQPLELPKLLGNQLATASPFAKLFK